MKVAVFGASGFVGKHLVHALLDRGVEVRALARNPGKLESFAGKIEIVEGDYFDAAKQAETLAGVDAVLSTIGPPLRGGDKSVLGAYQEGMRSLIAAMKAAGLKRVVVVGGAGIKLGDEKRELPRHIMRGILMVIGGQFYLEKEKELNILASSDLDWTIVRPPMIKEKEGAFTVSKERAVGQTADPRQIAEFMIDVLSDDQWIGEAPLVATT